MIDHSEFARLLQIARKRRGLDQSAVAYIAKISIEHYCNLEEGQRSITLNRLARVRRALETDINPLLRALPVDIDPVVKRTRKGRVSHRRDFGQYARFGRSMIRARDAAELTVAGVAISVSVTQTHVCRIESGHQLPSLTLFAQLHQALDFDGNILLESLLDPPPSAEPFQELGELLQIKRRALKLTRAQVATEAKITEHHYERIERGNKLPTTIILVHLHRVLRFDAATALRTVWESNVLERVSAPERSIGRTAAQPGTLALEPSNTVGSIEVDDVPR